MLIKHYLAVTPNIGDSIINRATRKIVGRIFPDAEIMSFRSHADFYSMAPETRGQSFDTACDALNGIGPASLNLYRKPDAIVIGGSPIWNSRLMCGIRVDEADVSGIPIIVIGVGTFHTINPRESAQSDVAAFHQDLKRIWSSVVICSARDRPTYDQISPLGAPTYMTGCPVHHYIGNDIAPRASNYFVISYRSVLLPTAQKRTSRAALGGRQLLKAVLPEPLRAKVRQMLSDVQTTRARRATMEEAGSSVRVDYDLIRKLEDAVGAEHLILFHDYRDVPRLGQISRGGNINFLVHYDVDSVLPFIRNAKCVVTYRLHGEIMAATCGVPFFHVMVDGRGEDYMKTFDPEGRLHGHAAALSKADLLRRVRDIARDDGSAFEQYNDRVAASRRSLEAFVEHARALCRLPTRLDGARAGARS